jgi:hypothetical protein
MAIEVFNRHEQKYILDEKAAYYLQGRFFRSMEQDAYNRKNGAYLICNVYYDTEDSALIRESLSKPLYKEKLRLRSYGVPNEDSEVFVEIKKKYKGCVNKRRSAMRLSEAYAFLEEGIIPEQDDQTGKNMQVVREIAYILEKRDLSPMVYLAYERKAYFGKGDRSLRVSFDSNILARRHSVHLEYGVSGTPILDKGLCVMEVKTAEGIPVWLADLLSECGVYTSSFSKYGTEYKRMSANNLRFFNEEIGQNDGGNICGEFNRRFPREANIDRWERGA